MIIINKIRSAARWFWYRPDGSSLWPAFLVCFGIDWISGGSVGGLAGIACIIIGSFVIVYGIDEARKEGRRDEARRWKDRTRTAMVPEKREEKS